MALRNDLNDYAGTFQAKIFELSVFVFCILRSPGWFATAN